MVPPRPGMRLGRLACAAALSAGLAGCGATISGMNERPDRHYQETVTLTGRVTRAQRLAGVTLLEVTDRKGARILVRAENPVEAQVGDWVRVRGIFVPEAKVEDVTLYDVITAEKVERTSAPRIPDFM